MDLEILSKRISSFRTEKGRLTKISDEMAMEILAAWEQWTGPSRGFYQALKVDQRKVAGILGRAKKLRREGHFPVPEFKEVKIEATASVSGNCAIEIAWENGRVIRFAQVDALVEFLKKAA